MSQTILLVEDDPDTRAIYHTVLKYFGYRVVEAEDGEAGVRLARERRPDLVLMDVSLPLLDGWEATRRLRADADTSDIPILALTACALPADRTMAMELGCDGYLAKPIEPRLVVAEVQRLLRERSGRCARSVAVESAA